METRNERKITEMKAVEEYRQSSEIFRNLVKAINSKPSSFSHEKKDMNDLLDATTFSQMIAIAQRYELVTGDVFTAKNSVEAFVTRAMCYFGSSSIFHNPQANFAYAAINLKDDIVNYAVDHGFMKLENENTKLLGS